MSRSERQERESTMKKSESKKKRVGKQSTESGKQKSKPAHICKARPRAWRRSACDSASEHHIRSCAGSDAYSFAGAYAFTFANACAFAGDERNAAPGREAHRD